MTTITDPCLTQRLRKENDDLWEAAIGHPFVRAIADGTLAPAKFRRYLKQDQIYLTVYARCLGLGLAKSRDADELLLFADFIDRLVKGESLSNAALLAELEKLCGPDTDPSPVPAPATRAYADFMLSVAYTGDPLDILTSLLPCAWSYAEIGRRRALELTEHPVYAGWLRFLTSPDYTREVEAHIAGVDIRAARLPEAGRERLATIFRTASELELGFWNMAEES